VEVNNISFDESTTIQELQYKAQGVLQKPMYTEVLSEMRRRWFDGA